MASCAVFVDVDWIAGQHALQRSKWAADRWFEPRGPAPEPQHPVDRRGAGGLALL